jgi:bile acid-coenzyme A ligase
MTDAEISLGARLGQLAAARPGAIAVSCGDDRRSWGDLDRRSNRLARALAARGVGEGSFVTIALPNSIGFIEACFACWKLGATPQPVSSRLPKAEIDGIVALADPPLVIAGPELAVERTRADIEQLLAESEDASPLPDRIAPSWKAPTSGGSTGRPKLIVSGTRGILSPTQIEYFRLRPDDVALMPGPLYHNGPFSCAILALTTGAELVLMAKFDAEGVLAAIDRHRATWLYLVPTMMSRIWRLGPERRARYAVASLRTVWHLAAPCPPWLKEAWIDWLGGAVIWELYAGTESQASTVISGTEWLDRRGSVGRVATGQMKILDAAGRELPPGETGEIYMRRSDGLPATYRYVGAEARRIGDWESLGDIGWFDAEGYLYLADRRTDMILVGGSNVYPAEVEAALDEHPLVQSSAVIGLPDEDLGNRIHAVVQPRAGLDLEHLQLHLAERLVAYKRPRSIEIVSEPLRDDAGKVRRSQLRAERLAGAQHRRPEPRSGDEKKPQRHPGPAREAGRSQSDR